MWGNNRYAYRDFFYASRHKYEAKILLTTLESQIVDVLLLHPEYQFIFEDESLKEQDYFPVLGDVNPFLHLSLHLGLQEQLATNRPQGIREIYQALLALKQDAHGTQHLMMEQIAEMMQLAAKGGVLDDEAYLSGLKSLLRT